MRAARLGVQGVPSRPRGFEERPAGGQKIRRQPNRKGTSPPRGGPTHPEHNPGSSVMGSIIYGGGANSGVLNTLGRQPSAFGMQSGRAAACTTDALDEMVDQLESRATQAAAPRGGAPGGGAPVGDAPSGVSFGGVEALGPRPPIFVRTGSAGRRVHSASDAPSGGSRLRAHFRADVAPQQPAWGQHAAQPAPMAGQHTVGAGSIGGGPHAPLLSQQLSGGSLACGGHDMPPPSGARADPSAVVESGGAARLAVSPPFRRLPLGPAMRPWPEDHDKTGARGSAEPLGSRGSGLGNELNSSHGSGTGLGCYQPSEPDIAPPLMQTQQSSFGSDAGAGFSAPFGAPPMQPQQSFVAPPVQSQPPGSGWGGAASQPAVPPLPTQPACGLGAGPTYSPDNPAAPPTWQLVSDLRAQLDQLRRVAAQGVNLSLPVDSTRGVRADDGTLRPLQLHVWYAPDAAVPPAANGAAAQARWQYAFMSPRG